MVCTPVAEKRCRLIETLILTTEIAGSLLSVPAESSLRNLVANAARGSVGKQQANDGKQSEQGKAVGMLPGPVGCHGPIFRLSCLHILCL